MKRVVNISHWDSYVSFAMLCQNGIYGIYIKASEGDYREDPMFWQNWQRSIGLVERGAFHFWIPNIDPLKQAQLFYDLLGSAGSEFPPCIDFEPDKKRFPVNPAKMSDDLFATFNEVQRLTGTQPVIYTSKMFWEHYFPKPAPVDWVVERQVKLWLAQYPNPKPPYGTKFDQWNLVHYAYQNPLPPREWVGLPLWMWQFSERGKVAGIPAACDLNFYYEAT